MGGKNIAVHPLGDACLSECDKSGVTAVCDDVFGQIHNYKNLYVADESLLPSAVGANPSATISALSEKVAHIVGEAPTSEL